MRPSLLAILVLSFLLYEAQCIRIAKITSPTGDRKIQEDNSALNKGSEEAIVCKDRNCQERNRKLLPKNVSTSATTTISTTKNGKQEINKSEAETKSNSKEEIFAANPSVVSGHVKANSKGNQKADPEDYPDDLDMAEMDYSLVKRKPPIHN